MFQVWPHHCSAYLVSGTNVIFCFIYVDSVCNFCSLFLNGHQHIASFVVEAFIRAIVTDFFDSLTDDFLIIHDPRWCDLAKDHNHSRFACRFCRDKKIGYYLCSALMLLHMNVIHNLWRKMEKRAGILRKYWRKYWKHLCDQVISQLSFYFTNIFVSIFSPFYITTDIQPLWMMCSCILAKHLQLTCICNANWCYRSTLLYCT